MKLRWSVLVGLFLLLCGWAWFYPHTGEGDAAVHYINAIQVPQQPGTLFNAWARPLWKALLVGPALLGHFPARVFQALLATLLCWQAWRLAEECELRNAWLIPFLILAQPYAFALASDTMSEIPMALAIVVAIRLWRNGAFDWSLLLAGFLPLVRPEGFPLIVLWLGMALIARKWAWAPLLAVGLGCWVMAEKIVTHDAFYFIHCWTWPMASYASYGHGPIYSFLVRLPWYCGFVMFPAFVLGVGPSLRRKAMRLPWAIWLVVLGVHTVLWWRGAFASAGLIRVLASTCGLTALIALEGFNCATRRSSPRTVIAVGTIFAVACLGNAMGCYLVDPMHHEYRPMVECCDYIREHHLEHPPMFFAASESVLAELTMQPDRYTLIPCDEVKSSATLSTLPIGSVGVWDNRQGVSWHNHTIEQVRDLGFEILFQAQDKSRNIRYAVVRKIR